MGLKIMHVSCPALDVVLGRGGGGGGGGGYDQSSDRISFVITKVLPNFFFHVRKLSYL